MKWASALNESLPLETALDQAIAAILAQLGGAQPDLMMVFTCEHGKQECADMIALLRQRFPDCLLLGSSAGGVIGNGQEIEQSAALSVTAACLPDVKLVPFHLENDQLPDPELTAEKRQEWGALLGVANTEQPHFILLADPFTFNPELLINGLDQAFPSSRKIGGLVSGANQPGEHILYLGNQIYHSGLVGLALHGDIEVDTVVAQGCRPIGEPLFVTEVEQNRILKLDGKTPLEVLQTLYEKLDERDRELLQNSLFVGMTMQESQLSYQQGDFLIRNIIGIDSNNGALAIGAIPQQNSVVQFHLRDAQTSTDDLNALLQRFAGMSEAERPKGSLLFSCLGRGVHLYGEPNHDSLIFQRHLESVPLGGFFCNGEIGPVQGTTFVHGYTSAFGLFRPK